jgi:hypothetical protein
MSYKNTANITFRRPLLLRTWRATGVPGAPLTSCWTAAEAAPATNTADGGIRQ